MGEQQPNDQKQQAAQHPTVGQLTGIPGMLIAITTAVTAAITAFQSYQEAQATSRATYEALKAVSEQHTQSIAQLHDGQLELRGWVQDLTVRTERQQAQVAEAVRIGRRRSGAGAQPAVPVTVIAPMPTDPPPPAPTLAPAPTQDKLPEFETLAK
jgi:gas vesicle protein